MPEEVLVAVQGSAAVAESAGSYGDQAPYGSPEPTPMDEPAKGSLSDDTTEISHEEEDNHLQEDNSSTESKLPETAVNGTNGHVRQNGNSANPLPSSPVNGNSDTQVSENRRLLLHLIEGDPEHDKRLLVDLRSILMDYRGECEVALEISTAGHVVEMEWPAVRVLAGDELVERLNNEVLGLSGRAALVPTAAQ